MYGNPYMNQFTNQMNIDKINKQINDLENLRTQITQQPMPQPTSLTQNFQLAPTNREVIRYAASLDEVQKDIVIGDTPYFSKDMSVVWIKNTKGEIKAYSLTEIVQKDEKDLKIEFLQAQLDELKGKMKNESSNADVDESNENEESSDVQQNRKFKKQ